MPLIFFLFLLAVDAPEQLRPAILEGTVTHAASRTPIRKAKVTLTAVGGDGAAVSTDSGEDGRFVLKDVKPGRYRLNATKSGYETTGYAARRPGEGAGQTLRIDPGAVLTRMDIALPKHGVIAGKILDSDNEPVAKALVVALANVYYRQGHRTRLPRGTLPVMSNDLGEYRIGELPPGRYIVCAIPAGFYQPSTETNESRPAIVETSITTCYPNVPDMNDAPLLEIRDSSEIAATDIRLIKAKSVTVQGRVTGVPAGAGTISILNLNRKGAGPIGNVINPRTLVQGAEGRFEFKNVPPGSYILHTLPTGLGNMPFVVKANLEVGDQPLTDLNVPASVPFEVKAKIEGESGPDLKMGSIRVVLTPDDGITSAIAMGTPDAEGNLLLANMVPGRYQVNIAGLPPTHYVKEIRTADQVSGGDTVEVDSGSEITLTLGRAAGEITGTARDEKGEPFPGANVALIPYPQKPFRMKAAGADQAGVYRLANVAPGEYDLVALENLELGALEDEEYLKPLRSKLTRIKVDGSTHNVNLIVQRQP